MTVVEDIHAEHGATFGATTSVRRAGPVGNELVQGP